MILRRTAASSPVCTPEAYATETPCFTIPEQARRIAVL